MQKFIRDNRWPLVIFLAAFFLRLVYLIQIKSNPAFSYPMVDELWHLTWAREIIGGNFWGDEAYFRGPLYPYLLAAFVGITGDSIFWTRFIQIIIGSFSAVLVYLLGRQFFSKTVGIIAGFACAAYGTLIFYESMFLIPVIYIPLILTAVYLLKKIEKSNRAISWLTAGFVLGLAATARPNILLLVPLIMIWAYFGIRAVRNDKRKFIIPVIYLLGVLIPVLAVTARNLAVTGEFILISSQGGVNIYIGNNPDTDGLTMLMPEVRLDESMSWKDFTGATREAAEAETGTELTAAGESSFWTGKTIDFIVNNPGQFIGNTFKKVVYFLVGFENSDNADIYFTRNYSSLFSILLWRKGIFFPFGLILPLAVIGIFASWKRRRELILLYIFIVGYIPTVVLFLVTARHRLPVVPFLLMFFAAGILFLTETIKKKKWKRLAINIIILAVLIILVNQTYFEIGFQNISQIHFNQALTYERQGNLEKAEEEYIAALETNPLSPTILNNLGYAQYRLKKYDEALSNFRKAINSDRTYARAYNNAGLVLEARQEYDGAERFFKQAIAINPELYTTYINLSNLYLIQGDLEKAELGFKKSIEIAPDSAHAFFRLGSLYGRQKRFAEATEMFDKGAQRGEPRPPDYVNWGNIYFGTRKPEEAIKMFRRAIEIDESFEQAYLNLALTFHTYGFPPDSAEKYLNKILSINPRNEAALRFLNEIKK